MPRLGALAQLVGQARLDVGRSQQALLELRDLSAQSVLLLGAFVDRLAPALRILLGSPLRRFGRFAAPAQGGELVERVEPLMEVLYVTAKPDVLVDGGLEIAAILIERRLQLIVPARPRQELVVQVRRPRFVLTGCLVQRQL